MQLARVKIAWVKEYKYLGNMLADSRLRKAKRDKATKTRQWWGKLDHMSRHRGQSY